MAALEPLAYLAMAKQQYITSFKVAHKFMKEGLNATFFTDCGYLLQIPQKSPMLIKNKVTCFTDC